MKSYVSRTLTERVIFKVADLITCVPAYQYDVLVVSRRYQFSFSLREPGPEFRIFADPDPQNFAKGKLEVLY